MDWPCSYGPNGRYYWLEKQNTLNKKDGKQNFLKPRGKGPLPQRITVVKAMWTKHLPQTSMSILIPLRKIIQKKFLDIELYIKIYNPYLYFLIEIKNWLLHISNKLTSFNEIYLIIF